MHSGKDPDFVVRNPSESQGGVLETYITVGMNTSNITFTKYDSQTCENCGEEFCYGKCSLFDYENHKVKGL